MQKPSETGLWGKFRYEAQFKRLGRCEKKVHMCGAPSGVMPSYILRALCQKPQKQLALSIIEADTQAVTQLGHPSN
jgi:hypothetical protein